MLLTMRIGVRDASSLGALSSPSFPPLLALRNRLECVTRWVSGSMTDGT